jgi:hypothetical protein
LRNKCYHEFGNLTDGSKWDSAIVAFISQTSSKPGRNFPAAAAAFEPSPALMAFEN